MPTFQHGRNTAFAIQKADSTMLDISNALKQVNFPETIDTPETTAFGSTTKSYVIGIKDAKFSCSGMFDATTDAALYGIFSLNTPSSGVDSSFTGFFFCYGPYGNGVGSVRYTGRALLNNYQVSGSVSDMVAFTADFQVTYVAGTSGTTGYTGANGTNPTWTTLSNALTRATFT